jgi:hypothetical protein
MVVAFPAAILTTLLIQAGALHILRQTQTAPT